MFRTIKQVENEISNLPVIMGIDKIRLDFNYRISTSAQFPNTGFFDIYLASTGDMFMLSDYGDLYEYFAQTGQDFADFWCQEYSDFIKGTTGVLFTSSGMELVEKEDKELGPSIMRFIQAFDLALHLIAKGK